MELGDKHLKVTRASIGATQAAGLDMGVNAMSMFAKTTSADLETSRVLQLLNMVTPEELMNNDDYEGKLAMNDRVTYCVADPEAEIREDVESECQKFGQVLDLKIPRPTGGSRQNPGVGKIFVKFDTVDAATRALKALAGRKFSDRTVVTTYFSEVRLSIHRVCRMILTHCRRVSRLRRGKVRFFPIFLVVRLCSIGLFHAGITFSFLFEL